MKEPFIVNTSTDYAITVNKHKVCQKNVGFLNTIDLNFQ